MVVKRNFSFKSSMLMFESSVISYGSKTVFVNDEAMTEFESSVISYGSKTFISPACLSTCLRVV